jgi:ParB family transcriptional regulator, chromosome partitioning protein
VAGGRRLAALRLLAKDSVVGKDFAVPVGYTTDEQATEVSLTEIVIREKMHDADMIDAFPALHDKEGMSQEAIADRFGISNMTVRRRLKLAAVSPKLEDLFRADDQP